jgi:hypothetical protein
MKWNWFLRGGNELFAGRSNSRRILGYDLKMVIGVQIVVLLHGKIQTGV